MSPSNTPPRSSLTLSAEHPWMLYSPVAAPEYFCSYASALKSAHDTISANPLSVGVVSIAYVTTTLDADAQPAALKGVSQRGRLIAQIINERERQIDKGFTAEHDDQHRDGSMAYAAGAYLTAGSAYLLPFDLKEVALDAAEEWWPWEPEQWRPADTAIGNIDKAIALLLAERERMERLYE